MSSDRDTLSLLTIPQYAHYRHEDGTVRRVITHYRVTPVPSDFQAGNLFDKGCCCSFCEETDARRLAAGIPVDHGRILLEHPGVTLPIVWPEGLLPVLDFPRGVYPEFFSTDPAAPASGADCDGYLTCRDGIETPSSWESDSDNTTATTSTEADDTEPSIAPKLNADNATGAFDRPRRLHLSLGTASYVEPLALTLTSFDKKSDQVTETEMEKHRDTFNPPKTTHLNISFGDAPYVEPLHLLITNPLSALTATCERKEACKTAQSRSSIRVGDDAASPPEQVALEMTSKNFHRSSDSYEPRLFAKEPQLFAKTLQEIHDAAKSQQGSPMSSSHETHDLDLCGKDFPALGLGITPSVSAWSSSEKLAQSSHENGGFGIAPQKVETPFTTYIKSQTTKTATAVQNSRGTKTAAKKTAPGGRVTSAEKAQAKLLQK